MRKYKIFFRQPNFYIAELLISKYNDFFERTENRIDADVVLEKYIPQKDVIQQPKKKTIYIFTRGTELKRDRSVWKILDTSDEHFIKKYPKFEGITFCTYDVHPQKNMIRFPLNHMPHYRISQDKDYFKNLCKESEMNLFFNRCFWRGAPSHRIRNTVIPFLNKKNDSRLDLKFWKPKTGITYNNNHPAPKAWEYSSYFNELRKSDVALCIRGDCEWVFSFFDIVRAGAIPVCINTGYSHLGWEKIGINWRDLFLNYDISSTNDTVEDIYNGINNLLNDKDRCLMMKKNLRDFYKNIYLKDRGLDLYLLLRDHPTNPKFIALCGWGDFFAGKIIEIIENNFVLKDNNFFSKNALEIKGMSKL